MDMARALFPVSTKMIRKLAANVYIKFMIITKYCAYMRFYKVSGKSYQPRISPRLKECKH